MKIILFIHALEMRLAQVMGRLAFWAVVIIALIRFGIAFESALIVWAVTLICESGFNKRFDGITRHFNRREK